MPAFLCLRDGYGYSITTVVARLTVLSIAVAVIPAPGCRRDTLPVVRLGILVMGIGGGTGTSGHGRHRRSVVVPFSVSVPVVFTLAVTGTAAVPMAPRRGCDALPVVGRGGGVMRVSRRARTFRHRAHAVSMAVSRSSLGRHTARDSQAEYDRAQRVSQLLQCTPHFFIEASLYCIPTVPPGRRIVNNESRGR